MVGVRQIINGNSVVFVLQVFVVVVVVWLVGWFFIIIIIYPLTARVVGTSQMISQPVSCFS